MAQSATNSVQKTSPEKEAWELFEVGSNEEVIKLAEEFPSYLFLTHLGLLARMETGESVLHLSIKGISPLSPMVEAYLCFQQKKFQESFNHLELYFKNNSTLIAYPFVKLASQVYGKMQRLERLLPIIRVYKKVYSDLAFLKEEVLALYHSKLYSEVLDIFRAHSKELNDTEIHRVVGMALLFLGKNKEAETFLSRLPGKLQLPSFEEKRKEYDFILRNLKNYEQRVTELNPKELEDLGFAYLFDSQFEKAEKTFLEIGNILGRKIAVAQA